MTNLHSFVGRNFDEVLRLWCNTQHARACLKVLALPENNLVPGQPARSLAALPRPSSIDLFAYVAHR